ncbi:uncharacterized, partial [Tachysurus ichikawai]
QEKLGRNAVNPPPSLLRLDRIQLARRDDPPPGVLHHEVHMKVHKHVK